jgi:transcriptional regulator with XRE-family HTH domain
LALATGFPLQLATQNLQLILKEENMEEFGRRLKERMIDKNMTEAELAQKVQLWSSILTSYLQGERFPGYYTLLRIAEALDVSIDFLLGLKDEPELNSVVKKSSSTKKKSREEDLIRITNKYIGNMRLKEARAFYLELMKGEDKLSGYALYDAARLTAFFGEREKALEMLKKFCERNQDETCGFCSMGDIKRSMGRLEEAAGDYRWVLKMDPKHFCATLRLGEMAFSEEKLTEAYFWFDKLTRDHPLDPTGYFQLSKVLSKMERPSASRQNFLAGIMLNFSMEIPKVADVTTKVIYDNLGDSSKTEDLIEAVELIRKNADRLEAERKNQYREGASFGEILQRQREFQASSNNLQDEDSPNDEFEEESAGARL